MKNPSRILDLSIGNPSFLFDYWSRLHNILDPIPTAPIATESDLLLQPFHGMDYAYGPQTDLQRAIAQLHKTVGNINTDGKYIVVGAGATQVLHAAISALNETANFLIVKPPFWYRYKDIAAQHALSMSELNTLFHKDDIKIIVTPNNPDGAVTPISGDGDNTIYDLAYHWPQYTTDPQPGCPKIGIFSLAKATGHAGSRIGWAIVDSQHLADKMNAYIEHTTGGVSSDSQTRATLLLNLQTQIAAKHPELSCFSEGARILKHRWNIINVIRQTLPLELLNNSGMFMWCKVLRGNGANWALQELKIETLGGEKCGLTPEYFRVNIGCTVADFDKLIERLKAYK